MPWKAKAQFLTPEVFTFIRNFIRFNLIYYYFMVANIPYLFQKQIGQGGGGGGGESRGYPYMKTPLKINQNQNENYKILDYN